MKEVVENLFIMKLYIVYVGTGLSRACINWCSLTRGKVQTGADVKVHGGTKVQAGVGVGHMG